MQSQNRQALEAGWKITREFLAEAAAFPAVSEPGFAQALAEYHEYLSHNELELALDVLFEYAAEHDAPAGFRQALDSAAVSMGMPPCSTYRTTNAEQSGGTNAL